MTDSNYDEIIQFRAGPEKAAADLLDEIHVGGINVSELARAGLVAMLRRVMTADDETAVYVRYSRGEIDAEVAQVLLGEKLHRMDLETTDEETDIDPSSFRRN